MKNANTKRRTKFFTNWAAITVLAASLLLTGLLTACPHNPKAEEIFWYGTSDDKEADIAGFHPELKKIPENLVIPDKIKGLPVTHIRLTAFEGCTGITSVDMSACTSLTSIGLKAFKNCTGLKEVKLPKSLTKIDRHAFEGCSGLTSVVFADTTGWKAGNTPIPPSDLANAATAAKYLRETYTEHNWWSKN